MTNQDKNSSHITYNDILEIYQKCRENGDWAKVYFETRGGNEFFTISVNVSAGSAAGTTSGVEKEKKKKKPGQIRRDQKRREAFLERRRQAAPLEEAARTEEIEEKEVEKSDNVDTRAVETSPKVRETSPASSRVCTWDVGVEAPSPSSSQKSMSIDQSDTEIENEPLDEVENMTKEKKENYKWRINVESTEIEKLKEHVNDIKDSKVFKYFSKATGKFFRPIMSVDSAVPEGNVLVLDVTIDSEQFGIWFIENKGNWPTFVTNVKRIARL